MTRIKEALTWGIKTLAAANIELPRLETELLLAHATGQNRIRLIIHPEDSLSAEHLTRFKDLLHRRIAHEPNAYLIGEREFFGLSFIVSPQVLIPRPETELLVEMALSAVKPGNRIIDIGTGSGCIAVAVAVNAPNNTIIATDISAGALKIASQNAHRHGVDNRIAFVQANLATCLRGPIDLLLANPPYISQPEMETLAPNVKEYEPATALTDGTTDGLSLVRAIIHRAATQMAPGGTIFIEIGSAQGNRSLATAQALAPQARFQILPDLAGKDRILAGYF